MTIFDERRGDILESDCQTLVCPVNVVGVMGAGLAKAFANKFPGLLYAYRKACNNNELTVDSLWCYKVNDNLQVLCFPTKQDWRNDSKVEWIEHNLMLLADTWDLLGIKSIAIPKIGCGLGGLDWIDDGVYAMLYQYLDSTGLEVYLYV